jgi:ubiquinone/menaquinone biosynthesis C-methylase UbiE
MKFTGERLTSQIAEYWAVEHLHRYALTFNHIDKKTVVDIASGEGYGSYLMSKYAESVVGIDISDEAVYYAQNKYSAGNLKYVLGSAFKIPLDDNSVDVVVSFETIEHHDQHEEMMLEIKRILKNDGLLIISSPDRLNYSEIPEYANPFHVKELYFEEFRDLLVKHFTNNIFFRQKSVIGSLLVSDSVSLKAVEYSGNYEKILSGNLVEKPMYHIAYCSNDEINTEILRDSFFSAEEFIGSNVDDLFREMGELREGKNIIYNSLQYRIGEKIINLLRPLKRITKLLINNK